MVRGRDVGMEGTRRGRESARKIFEMGARSRQRNAIVKEECKRNRLRKKRERVLRRQSEWKGRVQDADGMLERKEKKRRRSRKRNTVRETGIPVKKWKD
jgi:hypothetical protein